MTIAKMLASMNHEVLGVDINPEIVQRFPMSHMLS